MLNINRQRIIYIDHHNHGAGYSVRVTEVTPDGYSNFDASRLYERVTHVSMERLQTILDYYHCSIISVHLPVFPSLVFRIVPEGVQDA